MKFIALPFLIIALWIEAAAHWTAKRLEKML